MGLNELKRDDKRKYFELGDASKYLPKSKRREPGAKAAIVPVRDTATATVAVPEPSEEESNLPVWKKQAKKYRQSLIHSIMTDPRDPGAKVRFYEAGARELFELNDQELTLRLTTLIDHDMEALYQTLARQFQQSTKLGFLNRNANAVRLETSYKTQVAHYKPDEVVEKLIKQTLQEMDLSSIKFLNRYGRERHRRRGVTDDRSKNVEFKFKSLAEWRGAVISRLAQNQQLRRPLDRHLGSTVQEVDLMLRPHVHKQISGRQMKELKKERESAHVVKHLVAMLRRSPIFQDFSLKLLKRLALEMTCQCYVPGAWIVDDSIPNASASFYILLEGIAEEGAQDKGSTEIRAGNSSFSHFRPESLLKVADSGSTIRAKTLCICASINVEAFETFMKDQLDHLVASDEIEVQSTAAIQGTKQLSEASTANIAKSRIYQEQHLIEARALREARRAQEKVKAQKGPESPERGRRRSSRLTAMRRLRQESSHAATSDRRNSRLKNPAAVAIPAETIPLSPNLLAGYDFFPKFENAALECPVELHQLKSVFLPSLSTVLDEFHPSIPQVPSFVAPPKLEIDEYLINVDSLRQSCVSNQPVISDSIASGPENALDSLPHVTISAEISIDGFCDARKRANLTNNLSTLAPFIDDWPQSDSEEDTSEEDEEDDEVDDEADTSESELVEESASGRRRQSSTKRDSTSSVRRHRLKKHRSSASKAAGMKKALSKRTSSRRTTILVEDDIEQEFVADMPGPGNENYRDKTAKRERERIRSRASSSKVKFTPRASILDTPDLLLTEKIAKTMNQDATEEDHEEDGAEEVAKLKQPAVVTDVFSRASSVIQRQTSIHESNIQYVVRQNQSFKEIETQQKSKGKPMPVPLRTDLQKRMENVLLQLRMSASAKLNLVLKYTDPEHANDLELALDIWERVVEKIRAREDLLLEIEEFEFEASDPRRHFRTISTHRLKEQTQRKEYMSRLTNASEECKEVIAYLKEKCDDVVTYKNLDYLEKMEYDYLEMLRRLQTQRATNFSTITLKQVEEAPRSTPQPPTRKQSVALSSYQEMLQIAAEKDYNPKQIALEVSSCRRSTFLADVVKQTVEHPSIQEEPPERNTDQWEWDELRSKLDSILNSEK